MVTGVGLSFAFQASTEEVAILHRAAVEDVTVDCMGLSDDNSCLQI